MSPGWGPPSRPSSSSSLPFTPLCLSSRAFNRASMSTNDRDPPNLDPPSSPPRPLALAGDGDGRVGDLGGSPRVLNNSCVFCERTGRAASLSPPPPPPLPILEPLRLRELVMSSRMLWPLTGPPPRDGWGNREGRSPPALGDTGREECIGDAGRDENDCWRASAAPTLLLGGGGDTDQPALGDTGIEAPMRLDSLSSAPPLPPAPAGRCVGRGVGANLRATTGARRTSCPRARRPSILSRSIWQLSSKGEKNGGRGRG
mmetsp:Transcript_38928/g.97353  ORF Transcript_38928/g.97353 Transcript_38928/m.97353 type:complete len:258 (-) Transcript_38928:632-1405(-)